MVAIIVTPFSVLSFFALPKRATKASPERRKLDWQGVVALAGGLILFVYAISDGNDAGMQHIYFRTAHQLTSDNHRMEQATNYRYIDLFGDLHCRVLPHRTYSQGSSCSPKDLDRSQLFTFVLILLEVSYDSFFFYSRSLIFMCSIYWFLNGVEVQLIEIFQEQWGWSALSAALHCLHKGNPRSRCGSISRANKGKSKDISEIGTYTGTGNLT